MLEVSRLILRHIRDVGEVNGDFLDSLQEAHPAQDVSSLGKLWTEAVLNQLKPAGFLELADRLGIEEGQREPLRHLWSDSAQDVLSKVKNRSSSGLPQVEDVKWLLCLERGSRFEGAKRRPVVRLQLDTDQGQKEVTLDFQQLKELHLELKQVNTELDAILK